MVRLHVKKNDNVLIIAGNEVGKKGKVLKVIPKDRRIIVEGLNMRKRHTKATQSNPQGGIAEKEAPIHISNVQVICTKCDKPTRVAYKQLEDSKRLRMCRKCGEIIDA